MVPKYPDVKFVCYDKLDYCGTQLFLAFLRFVVICSLLPVLRHCEELRCSEGLSQLQVHPGIVSCECLVLCELIVVGLFVQGDICSPDLVSYVMKSEKIDTVLHFAAQSHVGSSLVLLLFGFCSFYPYLWVLCFPSCIAARLFAMLCLPLLHSTYVTSFLSLIGSDYSICS